VALYNPNLAVWSHSPAANQMEWHVLDHLTRMIGWDPESSMANFASGGQEANHTAVAAALCRDFPQYVEVGIQGVPGKPALYVSDQTHLSFVKIAQLMGLGREAVRTVPTDEHFAMDPRALRELVEADREAGHLPFFVTATAGTTGIGVVDSLEALADVAEELGLWYHVDAAWGGSALLSPKLRVHLAGIQRADSVTWDAHKWLSVPMAAGMFFCRHPEAATKPFQVFMEYVPEGPSGIREPVSSTFQWTRRFIGLKLFMALAEAGEEEMARRIEHQGEMGDLLRTRLEEEGWRIVNRTPFPLVCFTHDRIGDGGHISVDDVVAAVNGSGRAWISKIPVPGQGGVCRACITSYRTMPEDLEILVEELQRAMGAS
jgi:glutamate/tyrosine decarboxylase-like PLP-dependent enzyme